MSLIIGFNVRDGIVAASDRCTTHHKGRDTSHNFDSRKIVILDDRLAVLHCGDYFAGNGVSVHEFLESCACLVSRSTDITAFPLDILLKYKSAEYNGSGTFFVCGFDKDNAGFIYEISISKNSVKRVYGSREFGGVWSGVSDVATPILQRADCDRISLMDAACLCRLAIESTGKSQLYGGAKITVGEKADVYVMHKSGNISWFSGDAGFPVPGK